MSTPLAATAILIHTVASLAQTFNALAQELLPQTHVVHLVDETLLQDTIRDGAIGDHTRARLTQYVHFARVSRASAVMVTCSSIGPAVDELAPSAGLPIVRVDAAMADQAVRLGQRIGVLGTLTTTLDPTAALLRDRARAAGRGVTVAAHLCEGAFAALQAGDLEKHDRRVRDGLLTLIASSDVVVLAQASMARVLDQLATEERRVPVLTSPRLGLQRLAEVMRASAAAPSRTRGGQASAIQSQP